MSALKTGQKVRISDAHMRELKAARLWSPRQDLLIGTVKRAITETVFEVDFSPIGSTCRHLHRDNLTRIGAGIGL